MKVTLSKKEIEFLNRLVEDNARHCRSCGFDTTEQDKLIKKFGNALQGGKAITKKLTARRR